MTAIRTARAAEGKFVQIANAAAQDRRLSLRARGVLLFVLSLPPDKPFTSKWLESQVPEGREAVRAALKELRECGYMRRDRVQDARGHWRWGEQVISDAPIGDEGNTESESPSDGNPSVGNPAVGKPSLKELKTQQAQDVSQEMVQERASRRAHASSERAKRTTTQTIADIREAIAQVHGEDDADDLTDGQMLGLYFTYANPKKPVRDLTAYMAKILGDAPYLDTFMANVEAICIPCWQWESNCKCPASSAA